MCLSCAYVLFERRNLDLGVPLTHYGLSCSFLLALELLHQSGELASATVLCPAQMVFGTPSTLQCVFNLLFSLALFLRELQKLVVLGRQRLARSGELLSQLLLRQVKNMVAKATAMSSEASGCIGQTKCILSNIYACAKDSRLAFTCAERSSLELSNATASFLSAATASSSS